MSTLTRKLAVLLSAIYIAAPAMASFRTWSPTAPKNDILLASDEGDALTSAGSPEGKCEEGKFTPCRVAAGSGDANAQYTLGHMYVFGVGVPRDPMEGERWARLAAAKGNSDAMTMIGWMYQVGKNYGEALRWYHMAADAGNSEGMNSIGILYEHGYGVTQDYNESMRWYHLAADKFNTFAMSNLGFMYLAGNGVAKDYNEAMKWFRSASDKGNAGAMNNIGTMYYNGDGVPQDDNEAFKWYHMAAINGDPKGMLNLGKMYDGGRGVGQDHDEASRWIQRSGLGGGQAQNNNQSAQVNGDIPLKVDGGTYSVPVILNGTMKLDFTLDSGASDVSLPVDVVLTLMRTGTVSRDDFIGTVTYTLADGTQLPSLTLRIRALQVGDKILQNVRAGISPVTGGPLLGQSFLARFKSWSIDNQRRVLILN